MTAKHKQISLSSNDASQRSPDQQSSHHPRRQQHNTQRHAIRWRQLEIDASIRYTYPIYTFTASPPQQSEMQHLIDLDQLWSQF